MIPSRQARLVLKNRSIEFERVVATLARWQTESVLPVEPGHEARLVLEEAFINIVKYAHPDGREHEIEMTLTLQGDRLDMTLEDGGVAFDPTAIRGLAIASQMRNPPDGLIGLKLIRAFSSECRYERRAGRNLLSLSKHFSRPASG